MPGSIYDVNVYLGRQRWQNELEAFSCNVCTNTWILNICTVENLPLIVQNKERMHQNFFRALIIATTWELIVVSHYHAFVQFHVMSNSAPYKTRCKESNILLTYTYCIKYPGDLSWDYSKSIYLYRGWTQATHESLCYKLKGQNSWNLYMWRQWKHLGHLKYTEAQCMKVQLELLLHHKLL